MKKIIKCLVIIALVVVISSSLVFSAVAATILKIDGYEIKVEDNGYTALSGWDAEGTLSVPNSLGNYYISEIRNFAFSDDSTITGLYLNNAQTLKRIGTMAFMGCPELSGEIVIPNRVKTLGMGAFQDCPKITSCVLYSGSKAVPEQLFYNCEALNRVTISYGFQSIGKLAFGNCPSLKNVTIPATVSYIDENAFFDSPNVVICCYNNSCAMQYAIDHGIDYDVIDPLKGDFDGDGDVTVNDATYIQMNDVGMSLPFTVDKHALKRGEVTGDSEVDVRDATMIQMKLANMISSFD